MGIDLPIIWMVIIGFGLMMYVVMDGFDLGIGIIFPFITERESRDVMVNSAAPVWDGNETWLVLGGAALLAAFPIAYSILLTALYFPLVLMLLGLVLRGVAFELRFKAEEHRRWLWDFAFSGGSYVAAFSQGVSLGAFLNGFAIDGVEFTGRALDCVTPFSLFTGAGLIAAYALLGSTWLVMKTEGALNLRMAWLARKITLVLLAAIGMVSLWTPLTHPAIADRWFSMPNLAFFAPVPILVLATGWGILRTLKQRFQSAPFALSLLLLFLGYSGLAISVWPNIVPPVISIRDAAAPDQSMGFALVGTLLVIPVILVYTSWSYYVFRGKVKVGEGYH